MCVYVCICMHIYIHMCTWIYTQHKHYINICNIHTGIHKIYKRTHKHAYKHIYIHIHTHYIYTHTFVQSLSLVQLCDSHRLRSTPVSSVLSEFAHVPVHWVGMPSNHLIVCCPLLLPSIFPSIRVFSNGPALCIRWTKYWGFSFSISPSNEYSRLISFCIHRFDLAVQATLKSLLQHHSSKTVVVRCSAFFMIQLWHPYMITGKTIALIILCIILTLSRFVT